MQRKEGGGGLSALVIDDHPLIRRTFRRMLASRGYTVFTATGLMDAMQLFEERLDGHTAAKPVFDLVSCDGNMPDGKGDEVYDRVAALHQQHPTVPMPTWFFITGGFCDIRAMRERALVVSKPFDFDVMAQAFDALFASDSSVREAAVRAIDKRTADALG